MLTYALLLNICHDLGKDFMCDRFYLARDEVLVCTSDRVSSRSNVKMFTSVYV
jgi:hypothetical protein